MNSYTYNELLEDLRSGREVHFLYKDETYYIGRGTGIYMFWKFYCPETELSRSNLEDFLADIEVDGKTIKELWKSVRVDSVF